MIWNNICLPTSTTVSLYGAALREQICYSADVLQSHGSRSIVKNQTASCSFYFCCLDVWKQVRKLQNLVSKAFNLLLTLFYDPVSSV